MSNYKPKKNNPNALKYSKLIEDRIREGIQNYLTMQAILDSVSHMKEGPASTKSLYKIYGDVIAEERFKQQGFIGGAMHRKIQEGDSKMIEFAARTKMGLNPTTQVKEVDEDEESKDAISTLAKLLGKDEEPDE